jgi:aminopeptidase
MTERIRALAELLVRFGANVQPGQIVALGSEPGKEELARAVAEAAYEQGAKFVDLTVFDPYLKRARALHAAPDTLGFVPPWYGQRILALGEHRCARIGLTGPVAPHLMEGINPALLGRDRLPSLEESGKVLLDRTTNWTLGPCPTAGWAQIVHPECDAEEALRRLWEEIAFACRLDEPDPVAAWRTRMDRLARVGAWLEDCRLDALRFEGPGTSLTVGLFASGRWVSGSLTTVDGIVHAPNIPTEEVFATPDPERVNGTVTSTKPLFASGMLIEGLRVRFENGRVVHIDAERGAGTLEGLASADAGAARLGEVALVDRESRVGTLGTVFYDTLLDENAASHIALGAGLAFSVEDEREAGRVNDSAIHIDFMIGSDEVDVTGVTADGREVALLREGRWQVWDQRRSREAL